MRDPSVRAADLLRITELRDHVQSFVVSAEAGTQRLSLECRRWVPAFAGTTKFREPRVAP